jgi:ADP-heptose:LPS heptosyltransferase
MKRFLIARLSALGDVVCTLPAAVALKSTWPDCHITWAIDRRFAGVVECCRAVDRVVIVKPGITSIPKWDEEFDAAFDLQGLLKSALCISRAKAGSKLGYYWQREGASMFSRPVQPDPSSWHVVDQYVDVVRAYGAVADRAEFQLQAPEDAILSMRRKLKERGVVGRFVVINAGAGWATKRWPSSNFAQLIGHLNQAELFSVLIGGKSDADREAASAVRAEDGSFVDLLGETSIPELIALIRMASVHVGGDTGSTHVAAAVGTPAVGLYSITRPKRSCPYGQIERCHYNPSSLAEISVDQVWDSVKEVLW